MFGPKNGDDPVAGRMFAAALKGIGIQPEVIEKISNGLLHDLRIVSGTIPELLARQEFILRSLPAPNDPTGEQTAWAAYLQERRLEYERAIGHGNSGDGGNPGPGNPGGG